MINDEKRIQKIEKDLDGCESPGYYPLLLGVALCEIARQLSRIADTLEEKNK